MDIIYLGNYKSGDIQDMVENCSKKINQLSQKTDGSVVDRANYRRLAKIPNLACAIFYFENNKQKKYIAHSAFNKMETLKYLSNVSSEITAVSLPSVFSREQIFETKLLSSRCDGVGEPYDRKFDTESKIIEFVAFEIGKNSSKDVRGKLILWTYLYPCPSCRNIISIFHKKFPNIEVILLYSKRDKTNPCDIGDDCDD